MGHADPYLLLMMGIHLHAYMAREGTQQPLTINDKNVDVSGSRTGFQWQHRGRRSLRQAQI